MIDLRPARAAGGTPVADVFLALELRPNEPHTSYFAVPPATTGGTPVPPGAIFRVPEPSRMYHRHVPFDGYDNWIARG